MSTIEALPRLEPVPETTRPPRREAIAAPKRAPSTREVLSVVAAGFTIFGVLVLCYVAYLFGATRLEHDRSQRSLMAQFDRSLERQAAPIGGAIPEGTPVGVLEIPAIGVREAVIEGTTGSLLAHGPGHLRSSPLPGQPGNAVIAGRRTAYGGPFLHLDQLERGDEIRVLTGQGTAVYVVEGTGHVERGDDDVLADSTDNRLSLITSSPVVADRRFVATARLRGDPVFAPEGRTTELEQSELGLHRDGARTVALLCWLQLLLLAALATAWLRSRWSRAMTGLVAVPVLALLALLVFDSFTPLLPSTL